LGFIYYLALYKKQNTTEKSKNNFLKKQKNGILLKLGFISLILSPIVVIAYINDININTITANMPSFTTFLLFVLESMQSILSLYFLIYIANYFVKHSQYNGFMKFLIILMNILTFYIPAMFYYYKNFLKNESDKK